jgi:hypothetical protein
MTVTNGGNVGIGTTSPGAKLHLKGSDGASVIRIDSHDGLYYMDIAASAYSGGDVRYDFKVTDFGGLQNAAAISILGNDGNVGIGTTAPSSKLQVVGGITAQSALLSHTIPNGTLIAWFDNNNTTADQSFGLLIDAGTSANDYALRVRSAATSELFRITGAGNVGIGASTPYSFTNFRFLTLDGTSGSGIRLRNGGSERGEIYVTSSALYVNTIASSPISFGTNSVERMRITSVGDVGIGTETPSARLENYTAVGTRPSLGDITSNYNIISGDTRTGTATVSSSYATTLTIASNADTFAANTGASIGFQGKWNSGQYTSSAQFASIFGGKENGTDANLAGYMSFATRPAEGNPTPRMRITSDGYVLINRTTSVAADYFLQINGQTYGESTVAFKQTGNLAAYFLNTISVTNGATFNEGTAWSGVRSINDMTFNGSVTIPAGAVVGGAVNANRLSFATASNTITMTQSGNNIRAIAGFQVLNQFSGTNNGTITHGAGILVQGVDRVSGASTPTFTNYYGIAINDMNEFSEASFTNRWGVYQVGTSDRNYFAGRTLIGSNVDGGGGQILQVTGDALITGSVRTGAPTSGTSQAWKLGSVVSSSVTLSTGSYVEVEINGTFYRLAIVTPA